MGGSLYGLQFSNPVDPAVAYGGNPADAGTRNDYMVGKRVGGVNVFGGGLGLYNSDERIIGGVGVSGDTSCADHMIAWRVRHTLHLDNFGTNAKGDPNVGGVSGDPLRPDNMIIDGINTVTSNGITDGFEQPSCLNTANPNTLPPVNR